MFVHKSSIQSEGFRSLNEEQHVQFTVETENRVKLSAKNVSGPNGEPIVAQGGGGGGGGGRGGGFRGGRGGGGD